MAHRDPETGQFVADSDNETRLDTFADVISQTVGRNVAINTGDYPASAGSISGGDDNEQVLHEVVGENFWDELPADIEAIAELIAYRVDFDVMAIHGNVADTAFGRFEADTNAGLQPGRAGSITNVYGGGEDRDLDGAGSAETTVEAQNYHNDRYLYRDRLGVTKTLFDTAGGAGAGGQMLHDSTEDFAFNFRHAFGRGPLVTEDDAITYNAQYYKYGELSDQVNHKSSIKLWWDIHATEVEPIRDILLK